MLPDDPKEREEELARRGPGYRALHTGVTLTEEEAKLPGVCGEAGEVVIPLGISGSGVDVEPRKPKT